MLNINIKSTHTLFIHTNTHNSSVCLLDYQSFLNLKLIINSESNYSDFRRGYEAADNLLTKQRHSKSHLRLRTHWLSIN